MPSPLLAPDPGLVIFTVRQHKVILDSDLAKLYGVPTKRLNEQVKRNADRFPEEFMFTLTPQEAEEVLRSRSQSATLKRGHNLKYLPRVFTEHGALMAANMLNTPQAVTVSVAVVKAFLKLRHFALSIDELARKVDALERGFRQHGQEFKTVFAALRELMTPPPEPPRKKIGFHPNGHQ
jgi:hypothetical protein